MEPGRGVRRNITGQRMTVEVREEEVLEARQEKERRKRRKDSMAYTYDDVTNKAILVP
jgi:hypothetical protein